MFAEMETFVQQDLGHLPLQGLATSLKKTDNWESWLRAESAKATKEAWRSWVEDGWPVICRSPRALLTPGSPSTPCLPLFPMFPMGLVQPWAGS